MFDLEREIANWSATLSQRCGREADVAELEDHLRATFEGLSADGMPPEKAFGLAVNRIGNIAEIDAEYEKNRSPLARFHSRLARWDRSLSRGSGRQRELGLAIIFASLIIAFSILLADANVSDSSAILYVIIVAGPLWLASRMLLSRR